VDLCGVIKRGAAEVRQPHQEEYAPWKRLHALVEPILGPCQYYWYMCFGRPYGVHVTWTHLGEVCSLYLGDPFSVIQMTAVELRSRLPEVLLEQIAQKRFPDAAC